MGAEHSSLNQQLEQNNIENNKGKQISYSEDMNVVK